LFEQALTELLQIKVWFFFPPMVVDNVIVDSRLRKLFTTSVHSECSDQSETTPYTI